ncbi:hypothetical protein M8J75_000428 [Diaphorina citri]|nr:hypothetical protein M8J75_000428 [Diaphorina citri]
MSGDVQPRKRNKDKQRTKKKEPSLSDIQLPPKVVKQDDDLDFDETNIHVQKDIKIGGNVVAKIFFALVFGALICMVGLIVFEHRGTGNEVQSGIESPWSQLLEGWIEDKVDSHDGHDVAHDEHEDEDEDHDLDETHRDHSGEDEEHEENEEHDDENEEENDENEEHDEENEEHEEENEEHEADDAHASGETEADDEAGIFSGFIRRYIQPTPEEEEVDEEGVFTGFINKYSVDKDDISGEVDKELDDDKELEDDRDLDEDNSKETDDDSKERDDEEKVVEDWRKIVYRSPAPEEDEEDGPYDIYHSAEKEDSEPKDINESGEQEDDDTNEDEPEESLIDQEHEAEDNAEPGDEDEGAGLAVKFGVGVALIVVAHVVLVSKWKANVDTDVLPPGPLPQAAQSPVYVEEISPPLPPVEEEPPPPVMDRRATLVEPGEVVLPPSDVDESDFGEYEEELDEEEEAEMSQSDVEPTQESTLVTYEYSPVDSEQEEEGEVSDNNSAPINDKWASGASRPTVEFNSEDDEILEQTGSEVEYSDNEPEPVTPTVQTSRHGGPKSADDYLMADITNEQDWEIRDQLDAADTLYNASESSF